MLEIRPNCEYCDKDLPPDATDACICTYECTFCQNCVDTILFNVCPNCGGGFSSRPIRPQIAYRENLSIQHQPASTKRINTTFTKQEITAFSKALKDTEPQLR